MDGGPTTDCGLEEEIWNGPMAGHRVGELKIFRHWNALQSVVRRPDFQPVPVRSFSIQPRREFFFGARGNLDDYENALIGCETRKLPRKG